MKIHPTSLLLVLLPALSAAFTDTDSYSSSNFAKESLDIPVDGKDGRPHAGPWVETTADRDRKSTSRSSDDYEPVSAKYGSKIPSAEHISTDDGEVIPHSNGGVMDDPLRTAPKQGTRGTEGGVSEKGKGNQLAAEKVPGGPREVPPMPNSEKQKFPSDSDDSTGTGRTADSAGSRGMLGKPADLPDKPYDIPHPKSPSQAKEDPLAIDRGSKGSGSSSYASSSSASSSYNQGEAAPVESDGLHSLLFSFTMIIVSEIGDKTFLVAALMAMRHPRLVVFSAAFCALIAMTILSAVLGHAVPHLIPKSVTKFMAAILFLVFGAKMMKEGREMSPDEGVGEEMREVEQELEEKEQEQIRLGRRRSSVTPHALEAGRAGGRPKSRGSHNRLPSPPSSVSSSSSRGSSPNPSRRWNDALAGVSNLFSLLLSPAWVQTFAMTFLGEWGDRSQIATIAMAAGQDYWWVTIGAITGHGICTAAAVIGGRAIAGRVSMRVGKFSSVMKLLTRTN